MIAEIQVLPSPAGTAADPYRHVDAAIAAIQRAGLRFEVGALGTTIEGDPEAIWPLLREVHEACIAAGAESVVTNIKVAEHRGAGPTIDSLTGKFRQ